MPSFNRYRQQYFVLGLLFALSFGIQFRLAAGLVREILNPGSVAGPAFSVLDGTNKVHVTTKAAGEAGLKPGDRIISINHKPYEGEGDAAAAFKQAGPGGMVQVNFERNGEVRPAMILVNARPQPGLGGKLVNLMVRLILPAFSLGLGFFVAFQRPFDRLAWIVLFLMMSFSQSVGANTAGYALSWNDSMRTVAVAYSFACLSLWPVAMLWFGVYFPERSRMDLRRPWLKYLLVLPVVCWGLVQTLVSTLTAENWRAASALVPLSNLLGPWVFVYFSIPISALFFQLGEKGGTLPTLDARRRLQLIWRGTALGLTPIFLLELTAFLSGGKFAIPDFLLIPALLLQLIFPITLAYVIVVQRAMDVRGAIRTGLQYTLAQGGVRILTGAIIMAIVLFVEDEISRNQMNRPRLIASIALAIAAALLLRRLMQMFKLWLDRRFFREAYNSEQILAELSEQVRSIIETKPLLETVAARISESLHVPRIAVVMNDGDGYRTAYAVGFDQTPGAQFPPESTFIKTLIANPQPKPVYPEDPESWTRVLPQPEWNELSSLRTELVLPLAAKNRLHGFISLGSKQSEQPYSRMDMRLLQSVAAQTGLALENSQLTAAIASEMAQRERLNRELEIAREVQQRLFPQKYPKVNGIEYAGYCRPAQGVGGDYYDFVEIPDGHFGLAIGDVSGKGIPAALLMASLQASLRGQAINSPGDLAALMANMNRLIFEASPSNRYATFFYGQYDPATRVFVYVNGGHNAPMVFRGPEVLRLEDGGPVVGLFGAARYQQGTITLQAGDLLLGFTDGISEAMNNDDEEFDEERLILAVQECRGLPPQLIIERLFRAADEFAAGAPQHDDMTAVVMKII